MRKTTTVFTVFIIALFFMVSCGPTGPSTKSGAASADDMMKMLPHDMQGVVFININKAMGTGLAKKALAKAAEDEDFKMFITASGIDLEKDVYMAAIGIQGDMGGKETPGAGIINLKYNPESMLIMIKAKAQEEETTFQEKDYEGYKIYSMESEKDDGSFVFFDSSTIIAGNEAVVMACLDVAKKTKDNLTTNKELMDLTKRANKKAMLWGAFLIPAGATDSMAEENPMLGGLKGVNAAALSFDFANANITAEIKVISTDSAQIQQIANFLTGIKGFGAAMAGESPELGEILNKIQITSGTDEVTISAVIPEELINTMIAKEEAKKKAKEEAGEDIQF
ncbi:MAG: DUF3352 domain-containing protein [Candidatus Aminicenantes bacterium]|nr:DUF3352 domain-containing protein [Candidatus Aminicenantes bacterium]